MRVTIETERLVVKEVTPECYREVFKWCGDKDVNKFLTYPLYHSAEDVKTWLLRRNPDDPDSFDLGFFLKGTNELIGMGGIVYEPDRDIWVIGYNLRKDMWGHGYVTEAMQGIIDYVRSVRPLKVLEGEFAVENNKSRRVMEKLGMTYYRDSRYEKRDGSAVFDSKVYRKVFD